MPTAADIRRLVAEAFGSESGPAQVVDCLLSLRTEVEMITPSMLANACGGDRRTYLSAMISLSEPRIPLLQMHYAIEDEDRALYPLEDETILRYLSTGELFHPIDGILMQDPKTALFVYFSPTDELRECLQAEVR